MLTNLEETRKVKAMLEALQNGFKIKFPAGEANLTVKKRDALDKAPRRELEKKKPPAVPKFEGGAAAPKPSVPGIPYISDEEVETYLKAYTPSAAKRDSQREHLEEVKAMKPGDIWTMAGKQVRMSE